MRLIAGTALLLFLSACAASAPGSREREPSNPRIANLRRAAQLPWRDEGRCVVGEASQPWPVLAERCYPALDHDRIRFNDRAGRCAVASAGTVTLGVGLCILAAPEIVVGAVVVVGVVVVGFAIKEALDAYEPRGSNAEEPEADPQAKPTIQDASGNRTPKPETSGQDWFPPVPTDPRERQRRPECRPIPGPPRGGNEPHDVCANKIPGNSFPGLNVLINGKHFDALVLTTRTMWEVKTDDFERHSPHSRRFFVKMKLAEMQREARLAKECGYHFLVGVRSEAHKAELRLADPSLNVVIMDWC
ncbi:hypothetical protein HUA76_35010 [Myxococcus sp. CA056]|uniref:DUF6310 domain-containing protein n=1 Tax=Myxococcus sp. CA056 TaxID=2741740 RepID=UPI00157A4CD8|nr:DUF6310 domain-containing protein [Myxococcus sp. CA056]NTX15993.1 hypothetical protein [Myxococcus sp. CA056]